MTNLDSILKSRNIVHKGLSSQGYDFSSSHVWMWELDYKERWVPKNCCFCTVVLQKTLESPLDCKEIQPVPPKGDQSWLFTGRTDVVAETPILWPPDVQSWFIWKDPDAGKDWGQEEKGTTEDEIVAYHHWLNGHEFGWTLGVGDGQGGLVCCGSWGHNGSDTTEQLNWTELTSESQNLANLWYCLFVEAISLHMAVYYLWLVNDKWETLRVRKNMTPIWKTLKAENSQEVRLEILTS